MLQRTATFDGGDRYSAVLPATPGIWLVEAQPIGETLLSGVSEAVVITED